MALQTLGILRDPGVWVQAGFPPLTVHDSLALFWYERLQSRLGPAPGPGMASCDDMAMLAELLLHAASYSVPPHRYRMYCGHSVYGEVSVGGSTFRGRLGEPSLYFRFVADVRFLSSEDRERPGEAVSRVRTFERTTTDRSIPDLELGENLANPGGGGRSACGLGVGWGVGSGSSRGVRHSFGYWGGGRDEGCGVVLVGGGLLEGHYGVRQDHDRGFYLGHGKP